MEFNLFGVPHLYTIIPISLKLEDTEDSLDDSMNSDHHFMNLVMVYKRDTFLKSINSHGKWEDQITNMVLLSMCLVVIMMLGTIITFKLAHCIFRPLRAFNF